MDTKALAKSKRAHSLHHSKKHHHPHQASKASPSRSDAATGSKKPTGEKPQQSHGSKPLPSNWDRYGEEFDLGSEGTAQESTSQPSEFVAPKSKGADYAHIIGEAKAQYRTNYSSNSFPASSDFLDDFTQDFGPLLSAKGQSMLSWMRDDTFEFENNASTSQEAAFLSLNLNTLAERLAKVKRSKRLFIDPELIPPELLDDELQTSGKEKHEEIKVNTSAVAKDSVESSLGQNGEGYDPLSSVISTSQELHVPSSEGESKSTVQVEGKILQLSPNPISKRNTDSAPTFEAASAEAELDMLLNSFNEITVLGSSTTSSAVIPSTAATSVESGAHDSSSKSKLLDDFDSWLDSI